MKKKGGNSWMGLITWIIIGIVILAIIGLGWDVFFAGIKKGADKVGLTSIINQAKQSFSARGQTKTAINEYQNGYKYGVYDAQHSSSEAVDGINQTQAGSQVIVRLWVMVLEIMPSA